AAIDESFGVACGYAERLQILGFHGKNSGVVLGDDLQTVQETKAHEFEPALGRTVEYMFVDFPVLGAQTDEVCHDQVNLRGSRRKAERTGISHDPCINGGRYFRGDRSTLIQLVYDQIVYQLCSGSGGGIPMTDIVKPL